jgi:hypothetical protein
MASIISNRHLVETPAPGRLRYGLFTAARVTDDLGVREIGAGFQFAALDCGVARLYDANCDTHPAKTFDEGQAYMEAEPYWVYSTRQCGTVGRTAAEMSESVRRRFAGAEQGQVEAALWGGTTPPVDPALTTVAGVVTVVPTAPGAGAAIAALEESFYDNYGYIGTIHINTRAYGALAYAELLSEEREAGVKTTPIGSRWSIGAGYGITGPDGIAAGAGNVWAFMTPPVWVRRSTIIAQDDARSFLDRPANQWMGLAERVYAHTWECDVVHAVQVPIAAPAVTNTPAV